MRLPTFMTNCIGDSEFFLFQGLDNHGERRFSQSTLLNPRAEELGTSFGISACYPSTNLCIASCNEDPDFIMVQQVIKCIEGTSISLDHQFSSLSEEDGQYWKSCLIVSTSDEHELILFRSNSSLRIISLRFHFIKNQIEEDDSAPYILYNYMIIKSIDIIDCSTACLSLKSFDSNTLFKHGNEIIDSVRMFKQQVCICSASLEQRDCRCSHCQRLVPVTLLPD
jgi:hypothetical protein